MGNRAKYEPFARQIAKKHGISEEGFVALLNMESGFNPNALSPVGARGIAQIMPATAKGWKVNPSDPMAAMDAAARNLKSYNRTYGGRWDKTLAAYNAGPGNVAKYGGVPPFKETQRYVKNLLPYFGGKNIGAAAPTNISEGVQPMVNQNFIQTPQHIDYSGLPLPTPTVSYDPTMGLKMADLNFQMAQQVAPSTLTPELVALQLASLSNMGGIPFQPTAGSGQAMGQILGNVGQVVSNVSKMRAQSGLVGEYGKQSYNKRLAEYNQKQAAAKTYEGQLKDIEQKDILSKTGMLEREQEQKFQIGSALEQKLNSLGYPVKGLGNLTANMDKTVLSAFMKDMATGTFEEKIAKIKNLQSLPGYREKVLAQGEEKINVSKGQLAATKERNRIYERATEGGLAVKEEKARSGKVKSTYAAINAILGGINKTDPSEKIVREEFGNKITVFADPAKLVKYDKNLSALARTFASQGDSEAAEIVEDFRVNTIDTNVGARRQSASNKVIRQEQEGLQKKFGKALGRLPLKVRAKFGGGYLTTDTEKMWGSLVASAKALKTESDKSLTPTFSNIQMAGKINDFEKAAGVVLDDKVKFALLNYYDDPNLAKQHESILNKFGASTFETTPKAISGNQPYNSALTGPVLDLIYGTMKESSKMNAKRTGKTKKLDKR